MNRLITRYGRRCAISWLMLWACCALHAETIAPPPLTVAVLETEVRQTGPDGHAQAAPPEEARRLQEAMNMLIWSTLSDNDGFVLVDRSVLDQMLQEKTLAAGGVAEGKTGAELVTHLRAAGVLVVPMITFSSRDLEIRIEAVSATTGQLLAEHWTSIKAADWEQINPHLQDELPALWHQALRTLDAQRGLPLVEVAPANLIGSDMRLQWLADDLADRLGAAVGLESGAVLLRPRQAVSTKEERLLAVMGLSSDGRNDKSDWIVAPDLRVVVEIEAKPVERLAFDQTPLHLRVVVSGSGADERFAVESTVEGYEIRRLEAVKWLSETLRARSAFAAVRTPEEDEVIARAYAQQELATVRTLSELVRDHVHSGWNLSHDLQLVRWRILQHALRAAHLDPTSEEAARYVAFTVDSGYFLRGQERSQACEDRTIAEGKRYLERFPGEVAKNNPMFRVHRLISSAAFHRLMTLGGRGSFSENPYDPQVYHYSRIYLDHALPITLITGMNYPAVSNILRELFIHCRPEKREEELAYWREIWEKRVMVGGQPGLVPWVWIEIGYWTGREDFHEVRRCYEELAWQYPRSDENVWGGNRLVDGKPFWKIWMERFLKRAGDPEWETWVPSADGPSDKLIVNVDDWRTLLSRLYPPLPQAWEYEKLLRVAARRTLQIPESVMEHGKATRYWWATAGVEIIGEIGQDIWLIAPGLDRRDINQGRVNHRLFQLRGSELAEVSWPATPSQRDEDEDRIIATSVLTDTRLGGPMVLVGTYDHGLACFRVDNGTWQGKWIELRSGLPGKQVAQVRPCTYAGKPMWLVTVRTDLPQSGKKVWAICVVDPSTRQVTILHRTAADMHLRPQAMAHWPGVAAVPVHQFDPAHWPQLDWADAQFLDEPENPRQYTVLPGAEDGLPRVLFIECRRGAPELWDVGECDPVTGEVIHRTNGGGRRECVLIGRDGVSVKELTGTSPLWAAHGLAEWSFHSMPPWGDFECTVGSDGVVWMTIPGGQNVGESHKALVGYRPAASTSRRWRDDDQWIGPFKAPGRKHITGLLPDGDDGLWLSTAGGGVFNVSTIELLKTAEAAGAIHSSSAWRSQYQQRVLARGWRQEVRLRITAGDLATVEDLLDAQDPADALDVLLYRAYAHGNSPKPEHWARSADLYEQIITHPNAEPAAKMLAFCNRVLVLQRAGRWHDLLVTIDAYRSLFPQVVGSDVPGSDWLSHIAQEAKKKLSEAVDQPQSMDGSRRSFDH